MSQLQELHEHCGIGAMLVLRGNMNVCPRLAELGDKFQHRGQNGSGAAVLDATRGQCILVLKGNGFARDILAPEQFDGRDSRAAIVQTRYPTCGSLDEALVAPLLYPESTREGPFYVARAVAGHREQLTFAMAYNGNAANYPAWRASLEGEGCTLRCDVDTEALGQALLLLQSRTHGDVRLMLSSLHREIDGAWNFVTLNASGELLAARDPRGFRPLTYAAVDDEGSRLLVVASEDSAIRKIWRYADVRDLEPGHFLHAQQGTPDYVVGSYDAERTPRSRCAFEWIYFALASSAIDGRHVGDTRGMIGKELAKRDMETFTGRNTEYVVVPIPDSGKGGADGYTAALGLSRVDAIRKVQRGRGFIEESINRQQVIKDKYDYDLALLAGRTPILIDDSIVRSDTLPIIIGELKARGVDTIHVRSACPPIIGPCYYGINMERIEELFAPMFLERGVTQEAAEILMAHHLGVTSLKYLPPGKLPECIGFERGELCMGCMDGVYPTPEGQRLYELNLSELRNIS